MHDQASKTFRYIYYLRFSLILWLFPALFSVLDAGVLSISTTTLSRGIFVPEYWSGYACVAFFVISTACVALIMARTVALNAGERFAENQSHEDHGDRNSHQHDEIQGPPTWLARLLVSNSAHGEGRAVTVALIPSGFTFFYLALCGCFEKVPLPQVISGLVLGSLMAGVFWYLVNAWYYFAYKRPYAATSDDPIVLGRNAARTILLPRRWFWLRMPDDRVVLTQEPMQDNLNANETPASQVLRRTTKPTLEDINTTLREGSAADSLTKLVLQMRNRLGLVGYIYPSGQLYEAQLFSGVATIGFLFLFGLMYPLTAPRPNKASLIAIAILLSSWFWALRVVVGGRLPESFSQKSKVLRVWKAGLVLCVSFFPGAILLLWFVTDPERFPTMAAVLLIVIMMGWTLSALAFWLDRYRIPVLTLVILASVLPRIAHVYDFGAAEDHFISTVPRTQATALPTPSEILAAHLSAEASPTTHPLVIVTATGGGLHASAWTTQVLREIYRQLPPKDQKNFADHILLMSTVSGGSTGLSYFLESIVAKPEAPDLDAMVVGAQCSSLEAVGWGLVYYDLTRATVPLLPYVLWRSNGDQDLDSTPLLKDRTWALRKAFERNGEDAYCWDSARRSKALNPTDPLNLDHPPSGLSWYDRLFPTSTSSTPRLTIGGVNGGTRFPAFTMNTTTVEGGDRFLLGNYRLPKYEIGPAEGPPAESFVDIFRSGAAEADLPLASAAQMSATFPYVSSATRISRKYSRYSEHFVDGGYYDDDGTSSAIEFLRYALDDPTCSSQEEDLQDAGAKAQIRSHGPIDILLIEIRNSADSDRPNTQKTPKVFNEATPEHPKLWSFAGLLQQLGFPLEGFWNAGHGSVTGRDRNGLDLLLKSHKESLRLHHIVLDDQTTPENHWYIHSAQDPLSWSLTPKEREEVASSSDRGGRLKDCYSDVAEWYAGFDALYPKVTQRPKWCNGPAQ